MVLFDKLSEADTIGDGSGKVMFVVHEGDAWAVVAQAGGAIADLLSEDCHDPEAGFNLDDFEGVPTEPGVYVADLAMVNLGPSDLPGGGSEYGIGVKGARIATAEEWRQHLDDAWPWPELEFGARS